LVFFKKLKLLIFTMLVGIFIPVSAWGVSGFGCIGATVAEYLIPGLGYGILGHYDKMLVLGGSRWIVLNNTGKIQAAAITNNTSIRFIKRQN